MGKLYNKQIQNERRKELRNPLTKAEQLFWNCVKEKQLGVKFRRQHGVGMYVVDFYCPKLQLVVEIDGDSHDTDDAIQYDLERSNYLKYLNMKIIRFTNDEVYSNIEGVIERVNEYINN